MQERNIFNQYINKEVSEQQNNIINFFYRNLKKTDRFYFYPNIPWKKFSNAREKYAFLQKDEHLIAFYDDTFFGNGKDGLTLTTRGLYWKPIFGDGEFLKYSEISPYTLECSTTGRFFMLENRKIYMNMLNRDDIFLFVNCLKKVCSTFFELERPSEKTDKKVFSGDDVLENIRKSAQNAEKSLKEIEQSYKKTEELLKNQTVSDIRKTDINNASRDILFMLEFFTKDNIDDFIEEREIRNGFRSIEEAGEFLGLEPHDIVRFSQNCSVNEIKPEINDVIDKDRKNRKHYDFGKRIVDY